MRDWLRNLVIFLLPWYHPDEERERDTKTQRVHERAERAIDTAHTLIESYRYADRALYKHRRLWRGNGV